MTDLQPREDLDRLFAERVEGYAWDELRCRICGWPLRQGIDAYCTAESCASRPAPRHRADGVAPVSTDDSIALAALERFADTHGTTWTISHISMYYVAIHKHPTGVWMASATSLAHAAVLAMLEVHNATPAPKEEDSDNTP